jgi:hypothetical protein
MWYVNFRRKRHIWNQRKSRCTTDVVAQYSKLDGTIVFVTVPVFTLVVVLLLRTVAFIFVLLGGIVVVPCILLQIGVVEAVTWSRLL